MNDARRRRPKIRERAEKTRERNLFLKSYTPPPPMTTLKARVYVEEPGDPDYAHFVYARIPIAKAASTVRDMMADGFWAETSNICPDEDRRGISFIPAYTIRRITIWDADQKEKT